MLGIAIKPTIGLGDALQFSSVPENYYQETGLKLYDVNRPWFFDCNPYVVREPSPVEKVIQMWNFSPQQWPWPKPNRTQGVYLSQAEIFAAVFGVQHVRLNRPRLYKYERFPYEERELILLHIDGKSHGMMPLHVIDHVLEKYGPSGRLAQIGTNHANVGLKDIRHIETKTFWDLAKVVSQARMFIGVDSGPSWVAACYPDVIVKKVRTKPSHDVLKAWVPLAIDNIHSHWDDRCQQIYNSSEHDIGFTSSYRKI